MYKFQIELDKIKNCPHGPRIERPADAFHLVKDPIAASDNFRAQCIKNPKRVLKNSKEECIFYALSMFDTAENLKRYFCGLFLRKPAAKAELGDCIAKANLKCEFGFYNKPNLNGHLSFWALSDFDYSSIFAITERI